MLILGAKSSDPLSPDYTPSVFNCLTSPQKRQHQTYLRRTDSKKRRKEASARCEAAQGLVNVSYSETPATSTTKTVLQHQHKNLAPAHRVNGKYKQILDLLTLLLYMMNVRLYVKKMLSSRPRSQTLPLMKILFRTMMKK